MIFSASVLGVFCVHVFFFVQVCWVCFVFVYDFLCKCIGCVLGSCVIFVCKCIGCALCSCMIFCASVLGVFWVHV